MNICAKLSQTCGVSTWGGSMAGNDEPVKTGTESEFDTSEYQLNLNHNTTVYEEQQRSAAAVNGCAVENASSETERHFFRKYWFRKK